MRITKAPPRDVVGIIGLPLRLQPLDFRLKLAKASVHVVSKFIGRLMLFGQPVECRLRRFQSGLIVRRKLDRLRIGSPHAMRVREIKMSFCPFPALGCPNGIGLTAELCCHQEIEQRHVFEIAAAIFREQVAQDGAARLRVGFDPDEARTPVRGGHMGFGQHAADGAGVAVVGQALKDAFLSGMVVGDGKGHQLFEGQVAIRIDLHQFRGDRAEPQALPHDVRRHAETGGDFVRAEAALFGQLLERLELVGGMKPLGYASTVLLAVWH